VVCFGSLRSVVEQNRTPVRGLENSGKLLRVYVTELTNRSIGVVTVDVVVVVTCDISTSGVLNVIRKRGRGRMYLGNRWW
jgi:hypothetical protein